MWQIQTRLKAPKNQFNNFGKYKYRSCEDIIEGLKPILAELKCTVKMMDTVVQIGDRFYVVADAVLAGPDGEVIAESQAYAREPKEKKGMDESQITGATSSYARKYALNGLFLIDDNVDSDYLQNGQKYEQAADKTPPQENPYKVEDLPKSKAKAGKKNLTPATKEGEKSDPGANQTPSQALDKIEEVFQGSRPVEVGESMRYETPVSADPLVKEFEDEMNKRMDVLDKTGSGTVVSAKVIDAFILYLRNKYKMEGTLEDLKSRNVSSGKMDDLWDQLIEYLTKK